MSSDADTLVVVAAELANFPVALRRSVAEGAGLEPEIGHRPLQLVRALVEAGVVRPSSLAEDFLPLLHAALPRANDPSPVRSPPTPRAAYCAIL